MIDAPALRDVAFNPAVRIRCHLADVGALSTEIFRTFTGERPNAEAGGAGLGFVSDVSGCILPVGIGEAGANHGAVEVGDANATGTDPTAIAIPFGGDAAHDAAGSQCPQMRRGIATGVAISIRARPADLGRLRRINPMQSDGLSGDLDGVAVNHPGGSRNRHRA